MGPNPVERRLAYLCDHWARFKADKSKRLLVWQVQDNAVRMLQCFFEVQKHQTDYTTGDLFIVLDVPFENSIQYSKALKESLAGQYHASRGDLEREGIAPSWTLDPGGYGHSAHDFIRCLQSLGSQHHTSIGHLVAVLTPSALNADTHHAFAGWLLRALAGGIPERLRLVVIDSIESPSLLKLKEAGNPVIHFDAPEIDALQTAQETFAQEAAVGPAAVFRNLLMGLMTLTEKAPADQVKAKAVDAVSFARKHEWVDQEVVIAVLVAGAYLKERRFDEAFVFNNHARQAAEKAAAAGHPAGRQLVLQTWFGEAGTHLAAGDPVRAAACYDQAAVIASQVPNLVLAIEAQRMQAFCLARAGDRDGAFDAAVRAMKTGERLKPDVRAMTTLPLAALELLRVIDPERVAMMEDVKHRTTQRELGARETLEQQAAGLESARDPNLFETVETGLAKQIEAAEGDAEREIQSIVAGGVQRFTQGFAQGRELLGDSWPLTSLIGVPAPTPAASA